ncbi:UPF0149 family protein [Halorhodospira halophila]|uniref:YecA family protein n=1 Tax=Halorhodospira halophila (strain DSM 244 / SL1) TaxID=349124 RepID=A1WW97_HALHL|nr:UPF0149 family protein [Halorhodospira halophila]ABM61959.1 yecA family protein [Halorhodospira halophila SL1]MBK1729713.1 YecA family protein [Halorhodospira halophila]
MASGQRYQGVAEVLEAVGTPVGAAEAHGMLTGMLSGTGDAGQAHWIAEVLADTEPRGEAARACLETLTLLYDETATELADDAMGFAPLLPAEDEPFGDRVRALAAWSSGFLFGLGRTEPGEDTDLPAEVREFLSDLAEISRVAAEPAEDEDDEASYTELLEYIRVGVLLCREHMGHPSVEAQDP